ncbi:hypothetical protein Tsubulata_030792, partial [Turnera subulata]
VKTCNSFGLRNHHHHHHLHGSVVLEKRCSFGQICCKLQDTFLLMARCVGHGDLSVPEGNGSKESSSPGASKSDKTASQKSHRINLDWRSFRANLFAREQAAKLEPSTENQGGGSTPLGPKWAHPIPVPESGCVLLATEKLDGLSEFERTVVLLLDAEARNPLEGPFGIVINRPLKEKIKHMKHADPELASTFADSSFHFGGPIQATMYLLKTREKSKLPGLNDLMPGLCFGFRNSLDEAAALVKKRVLKPQDFRFFHGYAGWYPEQLTKEIENDQWIVAACSSDLIFGGTDSLPENLWVEILELMGGRYSELSRKPKQDL